MTAPSRARRAASRASKHARAHVSRTVIRVRAGSGYRPEDVVLIVGAPRSGTTWISEAVAGALRAPLLFEPDHYRHDPQGFQPSRTGFEPGMAALYEQLLSGRRVPLGSARRASQSLRTGRLVVKSIRAVAYLPALAQHFPRVSTTLLVRHPCAVVASQLRTAMSKTDDLGRIVPPALLAQYPHLARPVSLADTPAGRYALQWAVDHWLMADSGEQTWRMVSYEGLVERHDHALRIVAAAAGCDPSALVRLLTRKSSTVWGNAEVSSIDSWRKRLDPADTRRVLEVVHAVGIDWYGDDPRPSRPIQGGASPR